jgi:hypothetical protein
VGEGKRMAHVLDYVNCFSAPLSQPSANRIVIYSRISLKRLLPRWKKEAYLRTGRGLVR